MSTPAHARIQSMSHHPAGSGRSRAERVATQIYVGLVYHYNEAGWDEVRTYPPTEQGTRDDVWISMSPALCHNLEDMGEGGWGIAWETGPDEWMHNIPEWITKMAADNGYYISPMNSWAVAIYQI